MLRDLGVDVHVLHDRPDGTNINDGCGSTHVGALAGAVVEHGADLGVAFDGDADRVLMVDAAGEVVDGDQIIALCAVDRHARGTLPGDTVVVTVMTNLGFRLAMAEHGIAVVETAVGDRYVLEALEAKGLALGGEQSGHVIFRDLATTGDGLLTAVQALDVVVASGPTPGRPGRGDDPPAPGAAQRAGGPARSRRRRAPRRRHRRRRGPAGRAGPGAGPPERHRAAGPGHGRGADAEAEAEAGGGASWSGPSRRCTPTRLMAAASPAVPATRPDGVHRVRSEATGRTDRAALVADRVDGDRPWATHMTTIRGSRGDATRTMELLWGLAPRPTRGPKQGLTLEAVVDAAVGLADAEGIDALSCGASPRRSASAPCRCTPTCRARPSWST